MNYLDLVAGIYLLLQLRRKAPTIEDLDLQSDGMTEEVKQIALSGAEIGLEISILLGRLFFLTTGMLLLKQGIYYNTGLF